MRLLVEHKAVDVLDEDVGVEEHVVHLLQRVVARDDEEVEHVHDEERTIEGGGHRVDEENECPPTF